MRRIKWERALSMALVGMLIMTGVSYAFTIKYRWYSDGYRQAWLERAIYSHDLDFGLRTGRGPYIADGDNSKDPSVYPDFQGMIPTTPGVREITSQTRPIFKGIHDDTTSIDATGKSIDYTEQKTTEFMGKIKAGGDDRLGHAAHEKDSETDLFQKTNDNADLSKYNTLVNPEKRMELEKLNAREWDPVEKKWKYIAPLSKEERQEIIASCPIVDVKDYSALQDPDEAERSDREAFDYYRKVATESAAIRVQLFDEIKELQAEAAKLVDATDSRSTLSDKQKEIMLDALEARMRELSLKAEHLKATEEEAMRKYFGKKQMESAAKASAAMWVPSYDPYHPTESDTKRYRSSATNFGFLSFSQ